MLVTLELYRDGDEKPQARTLEYTMNKPSMEASLKYVCKTPTRTTFALKAQARVWKNSTSSEPETYTDESSHELACR